MSDQSQAENPIPAGSKLSLFARLQRPDGISYFVNKIAPSSAADHRTLEEKRTAYTKQLQALRVFTQDDSPQQFLPISSLLITHTIIPEYFPKGMAVTDWIICTDKGKANPLSEAINRILPDELWRQEATQQDALTTSYVSFQSDHRNFALVRDTIMPYKMHGVERIGGEKYYLIKLSQETK